jgi:hypothetical protein
MFRTQERNARLDASLDAKLDQFLADTFPCSDPLPQPLFVDPFTHSMHSDRRCVLESSRGMEGCPPLRPCFLENETPGVSGPIERPRYPSPQTTQTGA